MLFGFANNVLNLFQGEVKGAEEEEVVVVVQEGMVWMGMALNNLGTSVLMVFKGAMEDLMVISGVLVDLMVIRIIMMRLVVIRGITGVQMVIRGTVELEMVISGITGGILMEMLLMKGGTVGVVEKEY